MMRSCFLALSLVLVLGCDGETDPMEDAGTDAGTLDDPFRDDCDAIVPEYCILPFPSDYWLVEDSSTASGNRVNLGTTTLPRSLLRRRQHADPTPFNARDGWSINASILAFLPGASRDGLPSPDTIAASIEMSSPTVLLDAATGDRVPHFAELDYSLACAEDYSSCDRDPLTGCETDLRDPDSCGRCDRVCDAGEVCSRGLCEAACADNETLFGRTCADVADMARCGEGGYPCSPPAPLRTLIIRPVVPLEHETRYIVAIRDVVDESGAPLAPADTFLALRDGTPSPVATIEARRDHFEDIFGILSSHGVDRADLQLAWDFTTASLIDDTGWMVSARDQALAFVGPDGPEFTIALNADGSEEVTEFTVAENANIVRRVGILMTVPLFMDSPDSGARINLGSDGMPVINGTAEYRMIVNIPRSATPDTPVRPIQYGHGLVGTRYQANAGWLAEFGNANGFMPFGVDWKGMAEDDVPTITGALGQLHDFTTVPERLVQGMVNALLAMRLMLTGLGDHPYFQEGGRSIIDTSAGFYTGDSQGGIFGATYMALTTDVERGILGVPGQPYNLLLNRSVDFDFYLNFLRQGYEDGPNIQIALAVIQQLWDRADPGSFSGHIMNDPLPGTMPHQVILQVAMGDHQVTTLAAHIMARAVGAVMIAPQTRAVFGIEEVSGPHTGSAIVEFDYGLPPDPIVNIPQRAGDDPHRSVRRNPRALEQTLRFFETGEIIHTCDGTCDPD